MKSFGDYRAKMAAFRHLGLDLTARRCTQGRVVLTDCAVFLCVAFLRRMLGALPF